jgi:uncharacterized protein YkwD
MTKPSFLLAALCLLALAGCAVYPSNIVKTPAHPALSSRGMATITEPLDRELLASLVVDYINLYRSKHNLTILPTDNTIGNAAEWMADYQATHHEVTHVTPQEGWRKFGERYLRLGGKQYVAGYENASWSPLYDPAVGVNFTYDEMARDIVDGWINSPEHHVNLIAQMDRTDGYIGVGVAGGDHGGYPGVYATMDIFMFMPPQALR